MPARNTIGKFQSLGVVQRQQARPARVRPTRRRRPPAPRDPENRPAFRRARRLPRRRSPIRPGSPAALRIRACPPASSILPIAGASSMKRMASGSGSLATRSDSSCIMVAERHQRRIARAPETTADRSCARLHPTGSARSPARTLDLLHGGAADAARRRVDDAQQADRILVATWPASDTPPRP